MADQVGARITSDSSSVLSSTAMNIRKFIRETELSDNMVNGSVSTAQTSSLEFDRSNEEDRKGNITGNRNHSVRSKLMPISEESVNRSDIKADENNHNTDNDEEKGKNIRDNAYLKKLKYLPNHNFHMNDSNLFTSGNMSQSSSIPNTFKYKSHPNAKTKSSLGMNSTDIINEHSSNELNINCEKVDSMDHSVPFKTSTVNQPQIYDTTPDWMPQELGEKWIASNSVEMEKENNMEANDFGSSVRITRPTNQNEPTASMNLQFSSNNTMIHNFRQGANETPMWKKASKEYEVQKISQPHLQNIFLSIDSQFEKEEDERKDNTHNNSVSSTFSTPMATMSNQNNLPSQLSKDQIRHLENILEDEKNGTKKNNLMNQNPESPLKLFGDKYNTFTKEKLTDLLAKMNNRSPELEPPTTEDELKATDDKKSPFREPKLKIRNFTKSEAYTEEQFLKNANNIFSNIQRRGFKLPEKQVVASNSLTTATSTPKNEKRVDNIDLMSSQDEYSPYSSDFDDKESDRNKNSYEVGNLKESEMDNLEYTSFDNSIKRDPCEVYSDKLKGTDFDKPNIDNESSYTFDEFSDEERSNVENQNVIDSSNQSEKSNLQTSLHGDFISEYNKFELVNDGKINDINERLNELEKLMKGIYQKDIEDLKAENARLKEELELRKKEDYEVSVDQAELTQEEYTSMQDFIKWKRASQLKLSHNILNNSFDHNKVSKHEVPIVRGRVKPGAELPTSYDNMILDVKNQKWIQNDNAVEQSGSLDNIEDLTANSEDQSFKLSLMAKGSNSSFSNTNNLKQRKKRNGLEVSFHLPHSEMDGDKYKASMNENVTQISQLDDMTFSQTRKRLVSVITDILSADKDFEKISWNDVSEIVLSNYSLDSIKDLNNFLPNLVKVNLSNNFLKFLDGLTTQLLDLDVSNNLIDNITSFHQYHDLQHVNVSHNQLINLSSFKHNIHLTDLRVSNNKLVSLNGINNLVNLTYLDISQNDLSGEIDFQRLNMPNLQELILTENKISSVTGIEYLYSLRILNLNENQIVNISCKHKHMHLKKLLVKFNSLKRLNLEPFPFLRVLRIDGNSLSVVTNFKKLKLLEEVSGKSQHNMKVIDNIFDGAKNVKVLDLSGNSEYKLMELLPRFNKSISSNSFVNVSHLVLAAMNLSGIPNSFANLFPNVRELNLNFNRINDISGLSNLKHLKKLCMVSNSMSRTELVVTGLLNARSSLKVLDLRLNPCNIDLYPYVFNPQELEYSEFHKVDSASPIQLETLDDIENFAIHYQSLNRTVDEWVDRDSQFLHRLSKDSDTEKVERRLNYETLLISYFANLKRLDGGVIFKEYRESFKKKL